MGTQLTPTWTCFDDALDFFDLALDPTQLRAAEQHFRLVHGICHGHDTGEPYAHAWVEHSDAQRLDPAWPPCLVWQGAIMRERRVYYATDRDWFYDAYRITRATRYSLQLALYMNFTTGHYGPWRGDYRELCKRGDAGRIMGTVEGFAPIAYLFVEGAGGGGGGGGGGDGPRGCYKVVAP